MPPEIPRTLDQIVARGVDEFFRNPASQIAGAEALLGLMVKLAPTLPWEFPVPIPRFVYDGANLKELVGASARR